MSTTFLGTNGDDTIVPGTVSDGVLAIGPDATPGDGDDLIVSRGGDDIVAGGRGNDTAALGGGDDVFGWAPGDGSDIVFGQAGSDTLDFDGDGADEVFALLRQGKSDLFFRDVGNINMTLFDVEKIDLFAGAGADKIDVADMAGGKVSELSIDLGPEEGAMTGDGAIDRITVRDGNGDGAISVLGFGSTAFVLGLPVFVNIANAEADDILTIEAGGGDDRIDAAGLGQGPRLVLDGGTGDDTINGGERDDLLVGGRGDDLVSGGQGNDTARLGAGDDGFFWVNGDGSDVIDGGRGSDFSSFAAGGADETFAIFDADGHAILTRDLGNIVMDHVRVEALSVFAGGGADAITIGDMSGTDVTRIDVSNTLPGQAGDGAVDTLSVAGTTSHDAIEVVSRPGTQLDVKGLAAPATFFGVEAIDALTVMGGDGNDLIDASAVRADQVGLVLGGGAGDDTITGGAGAETILGGAGNDDTEGEKGDDTALLGDGDDTFGWDPGDGNDVVIGDAGTDTPEFDGSDANEVINIFAENGGSVLFRDVGAVRMEMQTLERIELSTFGGTDTVNISDLTGSGVEEVVIDLGVDGAADRIVVSGSEGADDITFTVEDGAVVLHGLAATVRIMGIDSGVDEFEFLGLGGDDRIDGRGLEGLRLFVRGGNGDDVILGSAAGDALSGDDGDDVILAFDGDDALAGEAGDDVLDGGAGYDTLFGGPGDDVFLNGEVIDQNGSPFLI